MKNLQLSLKTNWFEITKAGIKTEDYREITPYWARILMRYRPVDLKLRQSDYVELCNDIVNSHGDIEELEYVLDNWYLNFKPFTQNTITLGYPKTGDTERILRLEHKGIEIRTGNPEWGAEPEKLYFVILHGSLAE